MKNLFTLLKTILTTLFLCAIGLANAQDLTSGLVSVWEFDETSGTTLYDSYGSNDGEINGAVHQAGKIGQAYYFDGVDDYIEVDYDASLETSNFSVAIWVNVTGFDGDTHGIFRSAAGSGYEAGYRFSERTSFVFSWGDGTNPGTYLVLGDMNSGQWMHIAATYDGTTIRVYYNGSFAGSGTDPYGTYECPLRFGYGNGLHYFDGLIDQTAVWNRELSSAEVASLYNSGNGLAYANWVPEPLTGGTISPATLTIEPGVDPGVISSSEEASGGTTTITYSWEQSTDEGSSWTSLGGESGSGYDPPVLSQTTWYRRVATSGSETAYSNESKITVSGSSSTIVSTPVNTVPITANDMNVNWQESFPNDGYFLYLRAWTEEVLPDGKAIQVQNGMYNFTKSAAGFSVSLKNAAGYLTYYAVDTAAMNADDWMVYDDTLSVIATKADLLDYWNKTELTATDTTRWGQGRVSSVNGQTGDVQLNADDIDDATTTQKFTNQADIDRLAATSGSNTGDQDAASIPGLQEFVENHSVTTITGVEPVFNGWDKNALDDFDGDYNSLSNKPTIPTDTDDQTASEVPLTDASSYYASSNVEGAFQELGDSINTLRGDLNLATAGGLGYSDFSATSPLTYNGAGVFGIQSNYFAAYSHTHNYDRYYDWDLYVEGVYKDGLTSGENLDFRGAGGISISYSGDILTIDGSGIGDISYVSAGEGLTGGGSSGTVTVNMGTPTTISPQTINNTSSSSHVHAITGFLALTGGTLTGSLTGTSASFSSTVTGTNFILSSDRRLKDNIQPINRTVSTIELKQFQFKNDSTNRVRYGVIAQDLEEVAPEMVYEDQDGFKKVAYIDFLIARLAELEAKVNQLESQIKELKDEK